MCSSDLGEVTRILHSIIKSAQDVIACYDGGLRDQPNRDYIESRDIDMKNELKRTLEDIVKVEGWVG